MLGCGRIEEMSRQCPDAVWGNHAAVEDALRSLGPGAPLWEWLVYGATPTGTVRSASATVG